MRKKGKIDVKKVMERVKKEIKIRLEQIMKTSLNDGNLVKAINCRVIPVAGYIMNLCNLRRLRSELLSPTKNQRFYD